MQDLINAVDKNGKGSIDERHPLAMGVTGVFGSVRASRALATADTVLVLGSKLDQLSTFNWRLPGPEQKVIHVDLDPEEIGRTQHVNVGISADARETAILLADRLKDMALDLESNWAAELSHDGQPGTASDDPDIPPERVVQTLSEVMEASDVLLADASLASGWSAQHFQVKAPGRGFIAPRGLAGIGWACGAAVGARLAMAPERRLVCLAGDGAWAYSLSEVETAVRCQLPITYVILNNSSLGWIRHTEKARGQEISSDFGEVDFAGVARCMGAEGERVESLEALGAALQRAMATPGPHVLELRTSADASPTVGLKRVKRGLSGGRGSSYAT